MRHLLFPLLAVLCLGFASCGNDEPSVPSNAISLNMPNDDTAQTHIGFSDVTINSSNNFVGHQWSITDLGKKSGFLKNPEPAQVAKEAAVVPGHFYQMMPDANLEVIAGERAFAINSGFYNVYVDSWLIDSSGDITGAKVSFAEYRPKDSGLVDWDSTIGVQLVNGFDNIERAEFSFRKGYVFDNSWSIYNMGNSDLRSHLNVSVNDNTISFSNAAWIPGGAAEVIVKVRSGNMFTRVRFIVKTAA